MIIIIIIKITGWNPKVHNMSLLENQVIADRTSWDEGHTTTGWTPNSMWLVFL